MVSIVFMARGINQSFETWKKFMESQMFMWRRFNLNFCKCGTHKDLHGTPQCQCPKFEPREEVTKVQGALRPIQLFEYTVPEECIPEALAMQNLHKIEKLRPEINNYAWILRKMMKLEPMPQLPDEIKKKDMFELTGKYIPMMGMAVYPIGIKRDVFQDFPDYGYKQEGL